MMLTDRTIKSLQPKDKVYRLIDVDGLYICVTPKGNKYFQQRYYFNKSKKEIHLGTYPTLSLKEARLERNKNKVLIGKNIDPSLERKKNKITRNINNSNIFYDIAFDWLALKKDTWNAGYYDDVKSRLERIVLPKIGDIPIIELTSAFLYSLLEGIQNKYSIEMAHRCKQYIGAILTFAISLNKADRNPINDLTGLLKPKKKNHYPSIIDPKELGKFLNAADCYEGTIIVSIALKLTPQLLCRPGELRALEWSFINWDENRIDVPGRTMKTKKDHVIPLTKQSKKLLKEMYEHTGWQKNALYVFPSQRGFSRPLSENGVRIAIRNMGYTKDQVVPHGFRATARTLLDEVLEYPVEIIEQQLAHNVRDMHGRAYNRTKHLKQRAVMMQKWADYLDQLKDKS
ncbi:integrase arm-type DNA-binding domain-containing protein [Gammaproteobacteria bacterium AS21]